MRGRLSIALTLLASTLAWLLAFPATPAPAKVSAQLFKGGLAFPTSFDFVPDDGSVFYGELKTGEIHVLSPNGAVDSLFFTVPELETTRDMGLLGLALHPDYPATPHVFVYATRTVAGTTENQILRITDDAGTGEDMTKIFGNPLLPGEDHNGGPIEFGPDGKLYAWIGDEHDEAAAQDTSSVLGKILRMEPDGSAPPDNPFPSSLVWSYGHRNGFGLAFDPETDRAWETENGVTCNDELNKLVPGRNFGWGPRARCKSRLDPPRNTNRDGPNPVLPKAFYKRAIAPTGITFCEGCHLGAKSNGRIFFGAWNTHAIRRVSLRPSRNRVESQEVVYVHSAGILTMRSAPDGTIYFSDPTGIWKLVAS